MNFPEGFLVLDCELSFGMIKGFLYNLVQIFELL